MTNSTEQYSHIRRDFLLSFNDSKANTNVLHGMFSHIASSTPDILTPYSNSGPSDAINHDKLKWNPEYFSRQLELAKHNFSRERLEHLILVRDHFRKEGYKGFLPPVESANLSPANKTLSVDTVSEPSDNLKKFVTEGDLLTIRTALRVELDDHRISTDALHTSLAWVKKQVPGLWESYIEKAFARAIELDHHHWTSDYYYGQIAYLKANFSEKRYLHLIEVRDLLRERGTEGFIAITPKISDISVSTPSFSLPEKSQGSQSQYNTSSASSNGKPRQNQSQHRRYSSSDRELNPIFKTALLIGGAIAALVVYLLALGR